MNNLLKYLFGPEAYWLIIFLFSRYIARLNTKPLFTFDFIIVEAWLLIPVLSLGVFWLYRMPGIETDRLIFRIWVSGIVFGHLVMNTLTNAYSDQGPGIGSAYIAAMILIFIGLLGGSLYVFLSCKN